MPRAKRGAKAPVHLILGDKAGFDSFLAEQILERILQTAVDENRESSVTVFHGDETSWGRVIESARTRSLFASRRALVVRGAEGLRGDPQVVEPYLDDPSPDVALVLLARKVDGRRQPWKLLATRGTTEKAVAPRGRALEEWLRAELSQRGLRLRPEGEEELRERLGQDLRRLSGELDKLEAWAEKGQVLSAEDVASVVGRGLAPPFYLLGDAVASHDVQACLDLAGKLVEAGESPLPLIATAYRSLRQLRMLRALEAERCPPDELVRALLPPNMAFKLRSLRQAAGRWTDAELRAALELLADADRDIKTGAGDARVTLTRALVGAVGSRKGVA